jgi:hypothetical protein
MMLLAHTSPKRARYQKLYSKEGEVYMLCQEPVLCSARTVYSARRSYLRLI